MYDELRSRIDCLAGCIYAFPSHAIPTQHEHTSEQANSINYNSTYYCMMNTLRHALAAVVLIAYALCAVAAIAAAAAAGVSNCRFARRYSTRQILRNATARDAFLGELCQWEANFTKGLGLDTATQMTYDGHRLDIVNGTPIHKPHMFSAPSKESIHVALLARVLLGTDACSRRMYTVAEALAVLRAKVASYERFHARFPGFGGFMPWVSYDGKGDVAPAWDWQNRVPGLDNGELFWAAFAAAAALERHDAALAARWKSVWVNMSSNAVTVFYSAANGGGNLRTVTLIKNQSLPVAQNTYTGQAGNAQPYLDDPYEGELLTVAVYLFSRDLSAAQKDLLWVRKRAKLQPAALRVVVAGKAAAETIRVQRGWWFSAHEVWKMMFLPYRRSAANWRVFANGERARTWYASRVRRSPGLWASVNGPVSSNAENFPYESDCGVAPIAFNPVTHDSTLTPYGGFPLFLVGASSAANGGGGSTDALAAAWLHRVLLAPRMQNQWGTTESTLRNGTQVAPLATWDSKITTVLAICGGVVDVVEQALAAMGKLAPFVAVVDREWGRVFGNSSTPLPGEHLPFLGPDAGAYVPRGAPDFTTCQ